MENKKHIKRFNEATENLNISDVSESYSDKNVAEIGKKYEEFRKYIKNLDYDDLMEYAELSQEFKTLDILTFLKKKSKFL